MKKLIITLLGIILFLTACDKLSKNDNTEPQVYPTLKIESDSAASKDIPAQRDENEDTKVGADPTQSGEKENQAVQVNPSESADSEKTAVEVNPIQSAENEDTSVQVSPAQSEGKINESITTPVLVKDLFLGGLSNGKWMQRDEFFNSGLVNFNGFEYDVYVNDRDMGKAAGRQPSNWMSGEPLQKDKYDEDYSIVKLYDNNNQAVSYDIAIKAEWNLFPRPCTEQSTKQDFYADLVTIYLKEYGLADPKTAIKQIVSADLEGDGTEEVLIAADNTVDDQFEQVKKGDNAVLIFRKTVDGEAADQIIEQDIRLEDDEYPSCYRVLSRVETIADLDGDSIMEVIVRSWYYEGEGWSIYKLTNNRLELVASNGIGA